MPGMPREKSLDSTFALMRDPYRFISKRCAAHGSDAFETRLLLQRTICMTGPEAARLFYDPSRFERHGAMPAAIQKTLLGQGGVQGLDGDVHRHRKQMFMSLMTPAGIARLVALADAEWRSALARWTTMREVVLYPELHEVLMRAACAWAGVPLTETGAGARTSEVVPLFNDAGGVGLRHLRSRWARKRADRRMAEFVRQLREGRLEAPLGSAAHAIAFHRDLNGKRLDAHIAAVELINVVRPIVAVSVYLVFVAHALHAHPDIRARLRDGDAAYAGYFVQEVRRFYPFFPAVAARTRQAFEWNGHRFEAGRRVMLDLHGTNHDSRTWDAPERFDPERFRTDDGGAFGFVPQGGGDPRVHHRCPGEWIAIELMKQATHMLTRGMIYAVPPQDLDIDWSRLPALPRSRFVIDRIEVG